MRSDMPSYICAMSEGDVDILEEIFIDKYFEFIECYWILKNYSENINNLTYDKKHKDGLCIKFTLSNLNPEDIADELKHSNTNDRVKITRSKNKIQLKISKK